MDDERPTQGYRTFAEAAPEPIPPREHLAEFSVPMLGPMQLELGLAAPIRLSLDREELRLTPGSGLRLRSDASLPPVLIRHLHLDLRRATLDLDATGIGAFEMRAASVALGAAFELVLPWQPGSSIVDVAMQNLPARPDGGRRVWSAGPASLWVDPDTRLELAVTPECAEISVSHAVTLRLIGIGIGLLAIRYLFGTQRLEFEGAPGQPLRNALLRFVAWVASAYLRKRLPPALREPGYDPFADADRRAHFSELAANFQNKPGRKAPAGATGDPTIVADNVANQEPEAGAAVSEDSSNKPVPRASSPVPADTSAPDTLVARLRALQHLRLSPGPIPDTARLIVVVPLGERGSLALCTDRGAAVDIRRRGAHITLDANAGLYLHAEQIPALPGLRIRHLAVNFGALEIELTASPPLGNFTATAIQQIGRKALGTRLSPAVRSRLEALGTSDELLRQRMGATSELVLTTPRDQEILLRHAPEALELQIPGGLELKFSGLDFLPDATITGLRYGWADGKLELDATPALGDFGNSFVTQLVRHRAAPHLPKLLGARGPDASTPIDPQIAAARPAVLFEKTIPVLGAMQVRLDPADRVELSLSAAALELNTITGIALLVPELELALVLEQFRFEPHQRRLGADVSLGDYITELLSRLVEDMALPPLRQRLPSWKADLDPASAWTLLSLKAGPLGAVDIIIPANGAIVVERSRDALELRVEPALEIRAEDQRFVPVLAFHRLRWQPGDDAWIVDFDPPVGPLIPELLQRVVHKLAPAETLANITKMLALPEPTRISRPPSPPSSASTVVYETTVPKLGPVKVCLDPQRAVDLALDRESVGITPGTGACVRLPGIGFNLEIEGIKVSLRPLGVHLETQPEAGPLFDHVLEHALRGLLQTHANDFWPSGEAARIGQDTLLVLGRGTTWGPLRISVTERGTIELHLDRDGVRLRSEAGLFISGPGIDWLPDFYLHTLGYTFEGGAVVLEISGIEENYYHEKHAVSPITQALLAHLIKVLALPKLPAWTAQLGVQKFPLPPVPVRDPARIGLYRLALPGDFGEVVISMAPDDAVTARADEDEFSFISDRGLLATLPGLRFELSLRGVRYHMHSGEIQVGGLGQLENALLEAVVARQLTTKVKQVGSETPGDVTGTVGTLLEQLPVDDKGRKVLFHHKMVDILLMPGARLQVRVTADGLAFESNPPLKIDGPARIDYMFNGIRYKFADASFHLDLDNGGALLSGLFTDVVIYEAETRLNDMFKPLLPPAMRVKGYNLARDPDSMQNIEQLIQNFAMLGDKNKKPAA
ncbi:MAG: hypothetical protein H0T76_03620 [Nannocystis sp.]|nr:hypothetical protein [Nannocystis sp.]MBA3545550.1 hypothetical protein [Nannocystis sp.]